MFGFDTFNDKRFANNHQSGSDYRVLGAAAIFPGDGNVYPQWNPATATTILQYNPIPMGSLGTNFRTNGFFVNDNLRWNNHLTFNLGLRYDRNHGVDSAGNLVANDSALSPRIGIVWDPKGDGVWAVSASVGRYMRPQSPTPSPTPRRPPATPRPYSGPIRVRPSTPIPRRQRSPARRDALRTMFAWCAPDSRGFCTSASPSASAVPGVSIKIPNGLSSPNVLAYAAGISRQVGSRAVVRADYSYRDYRDFYSQRIDTSTGTVVDQFGNRSDLAVVENTNNLTRRYSGMTVSATYRVRSGTDIGGNYTLSRLWGNWDGGERREVDRSLPPSSSTPNIETPRGTRRRATCRLISVIVRRCGSTTACRRSAA